MRRFVSILCSTFLLAGCLASEKEVYAANDLPVATDALSIKQPIIWQVILYDERGEIEDVPIELNEYGYDVKNEEWQLEQERLQAKIKDLARQMNKKMINPSINEQGEIREGQKQVELQEEELLHSLLNLAPYETRLRLPLVEKAPTVELEELEGIFNEVIGRYTTRFNVNDKGRTQNIALSAKAITYYVLGPGDEFSFNEVVGERTRERGYQEAIEIVNKEFVIGIGGGICQTSSTLFNAIDEAHLEVVERTSHSKAIGYVPPNRDATVSWGGPDFKFKNPHPFPVIIRSDISFEKGTLTVEILAKEKISDK